MKGKLDVLEIMSFYIKKKLIIKPKYLTYEVFT